ncbi:hypothetical protein L596_026055 [Steinernema carpocapsae]|uniref:MOSC domain-containing protein n=1 Tax=Steinernema carpocapsae TaxID=34508 RepID=A0A4U5M175_STECR|nr:hypothetical protein L596_026055 [Steinernema carpocapsae]
MSAIRAPKKRRKMRCLCPFKEPELLRRSHPISHLQLAVFGLVNQACIQKVKVSLSVTTFITVSSLDCEAIGPSSGKALDRTFLVLDAEANNLYTAKEQPKLLRLQAKVNLRRVVKEDERHLAMLHPKQRQEDLDCGLKLTYAVVTTYFAFTSASINNLNSRIQETDPGHNLIASRHLRPNIVVSGPPPFDNDRY